MKTETIMKYLAIGGVYLLLIIPFVIGNGILFPDTYFPFITGKAFVFRVVVELIFGAWLILALKDERYRPRASWIAKAIGLFLLVMLIADIGSENPFKSFWSNFERMEGFVTLIHLGVLFFVAGTVFQTEQLWNRFWQSSLVASLCMGVYGFLQLAHVLDIHQGNTRLDASLGNSAYLAAYMIFHVFLALFLLVRYLKTYYGTSQWTLSLPIFYAVTAVVDFVILYYTATRGALIGVFLGLVVIAAGLAIFEKEQKLLKKAGVILCALLVLVAGGMFLGKNTQFVKNSEVLSRFTSLATPNLSAIAAGEGKSRFTIWKMAVEGVNERPFFGWGQESFNYLFYKYYSPKMFDQEPWFDRAHNVFLDWLVAGGWFGLLSYLSIFAAAFAYVWKKGLIFSLPERLVLSALLLAYFVHNIFVFDQLVSYLYFFLVLAYLHSLHTRTETETKFSAWFRRTRPTLEEIGVPVVSVLIVVTLWFVNWNGLVQATELITAISPQQAGLSKNIELMKDALDHRAMGQYEARERLAEVAVQVSQANVDQAARAQIFNFAYAELKKQLEEVPNDVRYYYFTSSFLASYQRFAEAVTYAQKAVDLSPNKQLLLMNLGSMYLNMGKVGDALPVYKKAFDLEPRYDEARKAYALAAVYAGDEALQKQLLEPLTGSALSSDPRFLQAYLSTRHPEKAIKVLTTEVLANPDDIQLRLKLASIYLQVGDKAAATAQVKKAMEKHPEFVAQGNAYLLQIKDYKVQ